MTLRLSRLRERLAPRSPESMLVGSFAGLIGIGTVLLWLPLSHNGSVRLLDALFTATSAVCVTGLIVVDTGTDFTLFGQVVILLLIQTGGLGVMTFAALAFQVLGRRLSLRAQAALSDTLTQKDMASEFRQLFWRILRLVLVVEAAGALLLFLGMLHHHTVGRAAFSSIFHSISAFCNAGFSVYSDSLVGIRTNPLVVGTIMILIVLGGIGHPVMIDLWRSYRLRRRAGGPASVAGLELHTKVVLWTSAALILAGAVLLLVLGPTPEEQSWPDRISGALFQSVTARTAGFNTVDIGGLPFASLFLLTLLMFVGGSPGSCAGGIKTTTFALWVARLWSWLRGRKSTRMFGWHIPGELSRRASLIIGLAVVWNLAGVLLLLATQTGTSGSAGFHDVLFEQISAFGTVGLSTGLTPKLSVIGRLWIILTMFVGRLGPITLVMWFIPRRSPGVRYPEGRVMIG